MLVRRGIISVLLATPTTTRIMSCVSFFWPATALVAVSRPGLRGRSAEPGCPCSDDHDLCPGLHLDRLLCRLERRLWLDAERQHHVHRLRSVGSTSLLAAVTTAGSPAVARSATTCSTTSSSSVSRRTSSMPTSARRTTTPPDWSVPDLRDRQRQLLRHRSRPSRLCDRSHPHLRDRRSGLRRRRRDASAMPTPVRAGRSAAAWNTPSPITGPPSSKVST